MAQSDNMKTGGLEEAKEYMMEKDIPQLFEVIILYRSIRWVLKDEKFTWGAPNSIKIL